MPEANTPLTEWAARLDKLVREGIVAVQSRDADAMVAVQKRLREFIDQSPDYADALDQEANVAIINIDLDNSTQALAELKARRDAIARIVKSLQGIATETKKDAATLRLESVRTVVESTTKTINALKAVRETIKSSGPEKDLATQIDTAIAAIQDIRNTIECL